MKIAQSQYPLIGSLVALILILVFVNKPEANERVMVRGVIDGDTFITEDGDHVRILGIDAPEDNECYEDESRDFLISLIQDREVLLEKEEVDKDNYGRKLRHVFIDDNLVSGIMIEKGFAKRLSRVKVIYTDELISKEDFAKKSSLGIWGNCEDFVPIDYDDSTTRRERDSEAPNAECVIKGNISEAGFGLTYTFPGCPNYNQTKVNPDIGEKYFCSEKEAQAAGYIRSSNCPY